MPYAQHYQQKSKIAHQQYQSALDRGDDATANVHMTDYLNYQEGLRSISERSKPQ